MISQSDTCFNGSFADWVAGYEWAQSVDRLLSLRLPARREYITAAEYNALIDAIAEVVG